MARVVAMILAAALTGCATAYVGRVVDQQGRPAAFAQIVATGGQHPTNAAEPAFVRTTTTDAAGRFAIVTSARVDVIGASSADSKLHGEIGVAMHKRPYVITIQ
jgi:hypothetical protein